MRDQLLQVEDVLRKVFACDFEGLREKMLSRMWYWLDYQLICYSNQTRGCPNITHHQAEGYCKKANQVVTKLIRIEDLSSIAELMRQGHKVVHVLRDPRGTMRSRGYLHGLLRHNDFSWTAFNEMQQYCKNSVADFDFISKAFQTSDPLAESYLFLRYEDLALSPLWGLRTIYDFMGFSPDDNVQQWAADQHRKLQSNTTVHEVFKDIQSLQRHVYGTDRGDPRSVVDEWRRQMPFDAVEVIQLACKDFMERVGYLPFPSVESMKNNSQPTFIPIDKTPLYHEILNRIYRWYDCYTQKRVVTMPSLS